MAATKISDIVVPDVFNPYVVERTAELAALYMGGIVTVDPALDALARQGGKLINMPFFNDLSGADEVLSDSGSLTPGAIAAGQDVAVLLMRGRAWGVNDLAKALSGADPMGAIGDLVAEYWARRYQGALISSLKGVFADNVANDSGDMVNDLAIEDGDNAAAGNLISGEAVIDTAGTLGDAADSLSAIAVHSVVFRNLQKQNLIDYVQPASADVRIPTYLGHQVIIDDGMPRVAGGTSGYKYTSYLFGAGAVALGQGEAPVPTETDRDSLAGEDLLITRNHFLMHPRGIAFQAASVAGSSPTNTELEAAANWDRVYDRKNIRIAQLVTNG